MELRYDPASDTTTYVETFRAVCPVCGIEQRAAVAYPDVPRAEIDPAFIAALEASVSEKLGRARTLFLANPWPCGVCSSQALRHQTTNQRLT